MLMRVIKFKTLDLLNEFLQQGSHLIVSKLDINIGETSYHLVYSFHNDTELEELKKFEQNFNKEHE